MKLASLTASDRGFTQRSNSTRGRMHRILALSIICSASTAFSVGRWMDKGDETIRAKEFVLVDAQGRTCLTMSVNSPSGQARLSFIDPETKLQRMELGLELFGGPMLRMLDPGTAQGKKGSALEMSCEMEPGEPRLLMKSDAPTSGDAAQIDMSIHFDPSLRVTHGSVTTDLTRVQR